MVLTRRQRGDANNAKQPSRRLTRREALKRKAADNSDERERRHGSTSRRSTRSARHRLKDATSDGIVDTLDTTHEADDVDEDRSTFTFAGKTYETYQAMVDAKRQRNQAMLQTLGLVSVSASMRANRGGSRSSNGATGLSQKVTQRGLERQSTATAKPPVTRSRSTRHSGEKVDLVELRYDERKAISVIPADGPTAAQAADAHFKGRINDGSDLSMQEAIESNGDRWINDDALDEADRLRTEICNQSFLSLSPTSARAKRQSAAATVVAKTETETETGAMERNVKESPEWMQSQLDKLSIDNEEWTAKVTPGKIYQVCAHPSEFKLLVGAGDKEGYVGLWDVDASSAALNDGVSLFRPHSRPICCMEWMNPTSLVTASYDGTVRTFNAETGTFRQIFATYDDSDTYYADDLGFGLDRGHQFWTQHVALDHRSSSNRTDPGLFVSTSIGTALHLDLRVPNKQKITFEKQLSEKKINTLSLHPNGHTLASCGLDGTVRLWDIRKFNKTSRSKRSKSTGGNVSGSIMKPIAEQHVGLSVSSALFSPSGDALVSTSLADRLDIIHAPHQASGTIGKPTHSVRHNNRTGRWLATFRATWHPRLDMFVVGSMSKPRCIEAFDSNGKLLRQVSGDSLSSVMSRCCFHPSTDQLIMVGGSSGGRVVAVR